MTSELVRASTGVAAFAGLYYAVGMLVDKNYRDLFIDQLTEELRDTFTARTAYLRVVRARVATATAAAAGDQVTPGGTFLRNSFSFPSGNRRRYTSPRTNPARSYARIARTFQS